MSEKVNQLIDEIRGKSLRLKDSLSAERTRVMNLEAEIEKLKNTISEKETDLKKKVEEIELLRNDMKAVETNSIPVQKESGITDEQIDELVKEIEFCIAKLKG